MGGGPAESVSIRDIKKDFLEQEFPTPGPWPVRYQAAQQEVSGR